MMYYAVKIGVTTLSVVLISELAKRSTLAGAAAIALARSVGFRV